MSYLQNLTGALHVSFLAVSVEDGLEGLPVGLDAVLGQTALQVLRAKLMPAKMTLLLDLFFHTKSLISLLLIL